MEIQDIAFKFLLDPVPCLLTVHKLNQTVHPMVPIVFNVAVINTNAYKLSVEPVMQFVDLSSLPIVVLTFLFVQILFCNSFFFVSGKILYLFLNDRSEHSPEMI